ncbi:unnamed protein product [Leptidea sinapis]|uniref:Uncharacterized protein n=1 Tax=Leptidea sinapis TaxID=189913 RepID=A0A5E4QZA0_9NEOP|nr:unnamed protein product [Leptidea sinapis]
MAFFACKCLNIVLQSDKIDEITDIERLELSASEQRDIFFCEKLISCPLNLLKCIVVQPALVGKRTIGQWILETCLSCGQSVDAKLHDKEQVLINKSLQTTQENINNLKKSSNYSPVFNLLLPDVTNDVEMKENINDVNNQIIYEPNSLPSMAIIGLRKQLNQTLQKQIEMIEESVRQFKDQKYAEYDAFRERAQKDHKILASIISKARSNVESDIWMDSTTNDNGPPSPLVPPLQRRRLSSLKDAKKYTNNLVKASQQISHEEDSLDAEDIFDLEGTDSRNMGSDCDDYECESEDSNDEGIQITRGRAVTSEMARSLPIDMPKFPQERRARADIDDHEQTQDIAASIKALARSVHSDVFDLPRPRFSTQI